MDDRLKLKYMTMDQKSLEAIQLAKLRKQLEYECERSQYYRERIIGAGIIPDKLESIEELQKIPVFRKEDHRKSQELSLKQSGHPYGIHVCSDMDEIVCISATSGTTGTPTFYAFSKKDILTNNECTARALWSVGVRAGDTVLLAFALSMFVGGVPTAQAIQHLGAKVVPVGAEAGTKRLLDFADLTRPSHMILTPSFAEYLIDKCPEVLGKDIKALGIRTLICGGEAGAGDPAVRSKLEKEFGANVFDWMGGAYGFMSISCKHFGGMHIVSPDYMLLELIHPDTKQSLKMEDGAVGNIAYTSLEWEAGPILRYDMGDVTQVFTQPCPCGFTGTRLKIIGRSDDMLIVKGINIYPAAVKNVVAEFYPRTTGEIRIIIDGPGPKVPPPLHIQVEYSNGEKNTETLNIEIEKMLQDVLRFKAAVEPVPAGKIERTTQKAKLIKIRSKEKGV